MKNMNKLILLLLLHLFVISGYGQNIFPDKFEGCNTDSFGLEGDTMTVQHNDTDFMNQLIHHLGSKQMLKLEGELKFQIIVDLEGNSCLLSVENLTNVKTSKLKLKTWVDETVKWEQPEDKVAALILLEFHQGGIRYRRLGNNGKRGWHILEK
jgi:hypothetical protein